MTEKERVNRNVCPECENEKVCFCLLHFLHRVTGGRFCRQGRKKKEYRQRQATLEWPPCEYIREGKKCEVDPAFCNYTQEERDRIGCKIPPGKKS